MTAPSDLGLLNRAATDQKTVAERKWTAGLKPAKEQEPCDVVDALEIEVPEDDYDNPSAQADLALDAIQDLKNRLAVAEAKISTARSNISSLMNAYPDKYPRHAFRGTYELLGAAD